MRSTVQLTRTITSPQVRAFEERDTYRICSWITNRSELQMVSGDDGDCLTPRILRSWLAQATASLVLIDEVVNQPVGFCTISRGEIAGLPPDYIEMCHLLVNPEYKYAFVTSRLLDAAKNLARGLGYRFGCARIVPTNRWALSLARYHRGEEFTDREAWTFPGFRWFRLDLSQLTDQGS